MLASWGPVGRPLEASWRHRGPSGGHLGRLGAIIGLVGALLDRVGGLLGLSWGDPEGPEDRPQEFQAAPGVLFVRGPLGAAPRARSRNTVNQLITGDLSTPLARWAGELSH